MQISPGATAVGVPVKQGGSFPHIAEVGDLYHDENVLCN